MTLRNKQKSPSFAYEFRTRTNFVRVRRSYAYEISVLQLTRSFGVKDNSNCFDVFRKQAIKLGGVTTKKLQLSKF